MNNNQYPFSIFPSNLLDLLPIKKNFKLKVYAILSTHKGIPEEVIAGKILLTLVIAYDRPSAESATLQGLRMGGVVPVDYNLTRMIIEKNLEELVDLGSISIPASKPIETKEFKIKKGKEEMIAYIRYVFDKAGTPEEKSIAESVIAKYIQIKNA